MSFYKKNSIFGKNRDPWFLFPDQVRVTSQLFDLLSDNSSVDHPLCGECTDSLLQVWDEMLFSWPSTGGKKEIHFTKLQALEQQLELAEQDSQLYQEHLNTLNKETEEESCVDTLEADLAAAQEEEAELVRELEQLRVEEKAVEEELAAQTEARARSESEEEEYWRQYSRWNHR